MSAPLTQPQRDLAEFLAVAEGAVIGADIRIDCLWYLDPDSVDLVLVQLLRLGVIDATPRGWVLSDAGREALGLAPLAEAVRA